MATYTWRISSSAGGAFDVASDWMNAGEPVSTTVPSAGDTAVFAGGGGPITGAGSVDTIVFTAAAWSIAGQLTAATVTLDNGTLTAGTSGGQLVANGALQVGLNGGAGLYVVNGGLISASTSASGPASSFGAATLYVGSRAVASFGGGLNLGANGLQTSATVAAALLTVGGVFQIGASGTGTLAINGGGQVGTEFRDQFEHAVSQGGRGRRVDRVGVGRRAELTAAAVQ